MSDLRVSKEALRANGPNPTAAVLEAVLTKANVAFDQAASSKARAVLAQQLTPGQRAILAITRFEMEVNGGGFDSYFRYTGGDLAAEALVGLKQVGAARFAAILARAIALFPKGAPDRDTDRRSAQLDRILEQSPEVFGTLDSTFFNSYEGEESLGKALIAYIRAHQQEFITG